MMSRTCLVCETEKDAGGSHQRDGLKLVDGLTGLYHSRINIHGGWCQCRHFPELAFCPTTYLVGYLASVPIGPTLSHSGELYAENKIPRSQ